MSVVKEDSQNRDQIIYEFLQMCETAMQQGPGVPPTVGLQTQDGEKYYMIAATSISNQTIQQAKTSQQRPIHETQQQGFMMEPLASY